MLPSTKAILWSGCGVSTFRTFTLRSHSVRLLLPETSENSAAHLQTPYCRFSVSVVETQEKEGDRYKTPFVVYDTAKSSKCSLTTRRKNVLTWYSCGPTVYDSAHIGHASSFIRQDVIRRIMEATLNREVTIIQVMGITDIDDKIIRKANESGVEWSSISKRFEREFVEDLKTLKVMPPHAFTRVSDYIPKIIQFVGKLVENGYAYEGADGSVYFDTGKYGNKYGIFRKATEDSSEEQQQGSSSGNKKSVKDFALWKAAKPGEPFWNSPWGSGKGRPGWHIECSVMASNFFGPYLDVHTGGQDLIFPHHENEEAQCCAHFQSSQWTSHWLHMGHLHFKGDVKMSKSLGNTVSISRFLEQHSPDVLRVICIMSGYRKNIEYSENTVDIAKKILKKFHTFQSDTEAVLNGSKQVRSASPGNDESDLWRKLETAKIKLNDALLDDFDTPEGLKIVTELISDFNRHYVPYDHNKFYENNSVNFQLVTAFRIFVHGFLEIVGISSSSGSSSTAFGNANFQDSRLENVLDQFVKFRNQVRSYSLAMEETEKAVRKEKMNERKPLLEACDKVRKDMLAENRVEIKDHGKSSSWSFVDER